MEKMAGRVISGFTLFHGREIKYYTYFSRKKSGRENKVTLFHAHGQKWGFPYKFKNPPPYKIFFDPIFGALKWSLTPMSRSQKCTMSQIKQQISCFE